MRVSEIMSTPVRTVGPNDTAAAAWEQMRLHRTRHLVVTGAEGQVSGVISASDLGGNHGEILRAKRRVGDLMTEKVVPAQLDTTVREAANLMRGHMINCLPVFDGYWLKGIVTTLDLLELIGRGAERPMTTATRRVLKDRGAAPHQAIVRSRSKRASR
jgi:CBS domain-containing protein